MGKFIEKISLMNELAKNRPKSRFKVKFGYYGKFHTEIFEAFTRDIEFAIEKGYLKFNENGNATYLDWKPLGGANNIDGGIKRVEKYSSDEKYIYAITQDKVYSLPKYLESHLNKEDLYIFFGKRVK